MHSSVTVEGYRFRSGLPDDPESSGCSEQGKGVSTKERKRTNGRGHRLLVADTSSTILSLNEYSLKDGKKTNFPFLPLKVGGQSVERGHCRTSRTLRRQTW